MDKNYKFIFEDLKEIVAALEYTYQVPEDIRQAEENKNSFIKQQKLSEAKQARKDQMRRGKR
jgi:hypothetical protein